jgi:signal transduction histidine kinase
MGGMAEGLAHQMKNRLNVFSLAAQGLSLVVDRFVKENGELVESNAVLKKAMDYFRSTGQTMYKNVQQSNGIIQGVLLFARAESSESCCEEFSLKDVVYQVIVFLEIKHQLFDFSVEVDIDPAYMVMGIKGQIQECLFNVLDNGFEAIKEKMEYHLDSPEREQFKPLVKVAAVQKEKTLLIEIQDNGMGIKEENRAKIFSAFFTTKSSTISGSGIGMYVVKRMIEENHQGKIWFESEYGKGTKFYIELPRDRGAGTVGQ